MSDPVDEQEEALAALKRDYLRDAPERLAELRKDLAAFRAGEQDALDSLKQRFHRLAGSGGSYGFPRVTEVARAMEERILTPPAPTITDADRFDQAIHDIRDAFDNEANTLDMPMVLGRLPGPLFRVVATSTRYSARCIGYFLMLTPEYPWGWKGDDPGVSPVTDDSAPAGSTRFDFHLTGWSLAWIWIFMVLGLFTSRRGRLY